MNYSTLCAHRGLFWHVLKFNVHTAHTISHAARACKNSAGARSNTARVRTLESTQVISPIRLKRSTSSQWYVGSHVLNSQ